MLAGLTVVFDLQLQATSRLSASNARYIGNLLCHSFNSIFALRNSVYRMDIRICYLYVLGCRECPICIKMAGKRAGIQF